MSQITLNSGKTFRVEKGVSILDSAANAKIQLPFSCKTGRCSACKCRVVSGETYQILTETGLSDDEKSSGWILSCSHSIKSDVSLDIEELTGFNFPEKKTLPCRILKIERLSIDVVRVFLRLPPSFLFSFFPGQYIELIGPNGVRRSYSIANSNAAKDGIELHIRAVDGGVMSEYWFNSAKENDLLRLYGPLGTFFLRNVVGFDLVFLATGTGISPIKAMLESINNIAIDFMPRSVSVFWGGRVLEDLYFDVSKITRSMKFTPVLSRPVDGWIGDTGYVQDVFLTTKPDLKRTVVFACGSDAMVRSAEKNLFAAGLQNTRFFADAFVPSAPQ